MKRGSWPTEIAAMVWHVAIRDQMVPRFQKDKMPAPVAAP